MITSFEGLMFFFGPSQITFEQGYPLPRTVQIMLRIEAFNLHVGYQIAYFLRSECMDGERAASLA